MTFIFKPESVCSTRIAMEIDDAGVITDCAFESGCQGNLQGISRLVVGRPALEVASLLKGLSCRNGTSCPDQLAKAIESYYQQKARS